MSNDDLVRAMNELTRAMWDPTAPVPSFWPTGWMGVFLIFVSQIGAGIPLGVIKARDAGLSPFFTALLYVASDIVLAVTMEPILALLRWVGKRVEFVGRIGNRLARFSGAAGLQQGGVRGPLGLILFSFSVSPSAGRAASVAAGYGFISGWTLAIIGDMGYFVLVMASTLWISDIFGDDRLAIGAVLIGTWVLPMVIRRMRRKPRANTHGGVRTPAPAALRMSPLPATATIASGEPLASPTPRKRTANPSRRRPTRGLHR
jgi:hypothetical protein